MTTEQTPVYAAGVSPWGAAAEAVVRQAHGNLFSLIATCFPSERTRTFIELPDGRTYSYGDLETVSARFARLLTDLGVIKGDRIAVQVDKSPEAIFLYLACLRAGAAFLPLNTAYTKAEVGYFLRDAEPRVVICRPETENEVADVARAAGTAHVMTLGADGTGTLSARAQDLEALSGCVATAPDDLAAILYTSGTTGRSKGAMLSHRNLASNALALHHIWGFVPDDVLLHALPTFHTHGLFVATNCVLLNGSGMLFLPKFDADTVIRLLPRATVMMGVPTFYTRLLAREDFTADVCRNMRLFISGSAPLLEETARDFQVRTGHAILERYGMTETGMNTSNPLHGERIPGTVGFPLPGVEARVTDETGKALPPGEVGVLEVRGPNVFSGYWRMPEKTKEEFRPDGFFITGDVAKIDERGYVHIVGRAKDLIISGGFNVYPKEIELCLDALEGIGETAVIGVPHPDFGEAVTAVATRASGAPKIDESEVISAAKREFAAFKVPKRVFFVEALPRNAMGKVQKNELRERYKATFK